MAAALGTAYTLRLIGEIAVQSDPPIVEDAETHYRGCRPEMPMNAR